MVIINWILKLKIMKMKKLLFLLFTIVQLLSYGQSKSSSEILYENGIDYLGGIKKNYNPELGKRLLDSAVMLGNPKAMNELGTLYLKGTVVKRNIDSAFYWFNHSISLGFAGACINAGNIFRTAYVVPQDFKKAIKYFEKGVLLNDPTCKNLMAYMYYKGLGTNQDYTKAFNLYEESAEAGIENSMYFLGLCYRNGYGTVADEDLAKMWLQKANNNYNRQASYELSEQIPENVSVINPHLQTQLMQLKGGKEKFNASSTNNYEGVYTGYAIYYDWSGKFVSEIEPLRVELKKTMNEYSGTWKEGEADEANIKMLVNGNSFKFDRRCKYSRINRYGGNKPEIWNFNSANIDLTFNNDSIQLSGYVKFYSTGRKEPGKPLQIILKKSIEETPNTDAVKFSIFPNPATTNIKVEFTIAQAAKIAFRIYTHNGALLYTETEKLLPAGKYNYSLPVNKLVAGTYNIQLLSNGKMSTTNVLVKQ